MAYGTESYGSASLGSKSAKDQPVFNTQAITANYSLELNNINYILSEELTYSYSIVKSSLLDLNIKNEEINAGYIIDNVNLVTGTVLNKDVRYKQTVKPSSISGTTTLKNENINSTYEVSTSDLSGQTTIVPESIENQYELKESILKPTLRTQNIQYSFSFKNSIIKNLATESIDYAYEIETTSSDILGTRGEISVLIDGQRIDTYTNIEAKRRLNEVDTFSFDAFITDSADRSLINEGNIVKIIEDYDELIFKGKLTEVEYKSNFRAKCEGDGMVTKLLNRKTDRETFTNTAGDDIVKNIVPQTIIDYGTIDVAPQVSVRFDHDNKARAVAGVANATGYDWYVDQDPADDWETDRLNFVEDAGGDGPLVNLTDGFESGSITDGDPITWTRTSTASLGSIEVSGAKSFKGDNSLRANISVFGGTETIEYDSGATDGIPLDLEDNYSFYFNHQNDELADKPAIHRLQSGADSSEILLRIGTRNIVIQSFDGSGTLQQQETVNSNNKEWIRCEIELSSNNSTFIVRTIDADGNVIENSPEITNFVGDSVQKHVISANGQNNSIDIFFDEITYGEGNEPIELAIGEDASLVERNKDEGFVANDITLLGRGDGVNQLEAEVFACVTAFTDTTQIIDENESTSFTVDDTGQLGNTGDNLIVRVGTEVMDVTISDSTTLSINSRGLNDYEGNPTEQIKHYENIRVWRLENVTQGIGRFTPETRDTAEAGSSIESKGVKEQRDTDKTIVDISTLEKTADLELKNRFEDVFRIQTRLSDPSIVKDLQLGDTVTVKDLTAMDVDDEFDIVGMDIMRNSSEEGTVLHMANRPRRLTERLSEIESDRDTLNAHMQGATNFNSESFGDNCDQSNPLRNNFFVPDDVVQVNKFEVVFKRESFRGYVQNTAHSHSLTIELDDHTHSFDWLHDHDVEIPDHDHPVFQIDADPSGWVEPDTLMPAQALVIENGGGSRTDQIWMSDFNSDFQQGEEIRTLFESLDQQSTSTAGGTNDDTTAASSSNVTTATADNAGAPEYGIFEPASEPDIDVEVYVDGTLVQTVNNVSVGQEINTPISIKNDLSTPIQGRYHTVELKPIDTGGGNNGRSRLQADVVQKVFIESTV